jgi:hypothetical protein
MYTSPMPLRTSRTVEITPSGRRQSYFEAYISSSEDDAPATITDTGADNGDSAGDHDTLRSASSPRSCTVWNGNRYLLTAIFFLNLLMSFVMIYQMRSEVRYIVHIEPAQNHSLHLSVITQPAMTLIDKLVETAMIVKDNIGRAIDLLKN